jgi:hypothetical protein
MGKRREERKRKETVALRQCGIGNVEWNVFHRAKGPLIYTIYT